MYQQVLQPGVNFTLCQNVLKIGSLLHKTGFFKTGVVGTVHVGTIASQIAVGVCLLNLLDTLRLSDFELLGHYFILTLHTINIT